MQTSAPVPPRSHHHRRKADPSEQPIQKIHPPTPTPGTPHLPEPKTTGRRSGTPPLLPSSRGRPAPAKRTKPSRLLRRAPCRTRTGQPGGAPRGRGDARRAGKEGDEERNTETHDREKKKKRQRKKEEKKREKKNEKKREEMKKKEREKKRERKKEENKRRECLKNRKNRKRKGKKERKRLPVGCSWQFWAPSVGHDKTGWRLFIRQLVDASAVHADAVRRVFLSPGADPEEAPHPGGIEGRTDGLENGRPFLASSARDHMVRGSEERRRGKTKVGYPHHVRTGVGFLVRLRLCLVRTRPRQDND